MTFKIYYDDTGTPTMYTREEHTGDFIEVDAETFALCRFDIKIVNGEIVQPDNSRKFHKMEESDIGTEVLKEDISIIAPEKTKRKTKKMEPKIK